MLKPQIWGQVFKEYISSRKLTAQFQVSTSLIDSFIDNRSVEKVSTHSIFEDIKLALMSKFAPSIKMERIEPLEIRSISLYVFSEDELKRLLELHNNEIESMWRSRIFSDNTEISND